MNAPNNLLFDIELAISRLQETFQPADGSDDLLKTQSAEGPMDRRPIKTNESSVPPSFQLPEVSGCAGISFQAL